MKYAIVALMLLAACGDSTAPLSLEGDWYAVSVDGAALPVSYSTGSVSTRVVERRLTLIGNVGTWHDDTEVRVDGVMYFRRLDFSIEWTRTRDQIVVHSTTPGWTELVLTFSIVGDVLTNTDTEGRALVYRRF